MRKNSIKNNRINGEVMRELSHIISTELKDPRVDPMLTITDCIVVPDLKTAKVYVSVMGDEEDGRRTMEGLKSCSGFLRKRLAETLNLRYTPQITYILDESIAYGVRMTKLIDEVNSNKDGE